MYKLKDIEKILSFKTWDDKRKIDTLLEMDASIYAHLGTDSTKKENDIAKKNARKIYRAIKEVDVEMGTTFLDLIDK